MDGVHPPRCVEWRWCVLLLSCPVRWCGSCPTRPIAVLASTAVRVVCCPLLGAAVCGGECVSVLFVWWGILCVLPPRRGGGWGYRGWWGAVVVVGGMVSEGRLCCVASPSCVWCPPSVCWRPPCRLLCGPIEWRVWCVVCCPRVWIGSSLSHCSRPFHIVLALLVLSYFLSCCPLSLLPLCLLSQHCWFRVVSL